MMLSRLRQALSAGVRLACPRCGARTLFRGAFTMHERCAACGLKFEREPGYFVGAIYINYAVTTVLMIAGFLLLDAWVHPTITAQIVGWSAFGIGFPLWFFRYSKSLWLAIDHFLSPEDEDPPLRVVHHDS